MSDTPMTYTNDLDSDGIDEGDASNHRVRNWVIFVLSLVLLAGVIFIGAEIYERSRMPALFIAEQGDTAVERVGGDLGLAITMAKRVREPMMATPMCGQPRHRLLPKGECGKAQPVSYRVARQLAGSTDTVLLDMPIKRGDLVDAKRGHFIPWKRRDEVVQYFVDHVDPRSPEFATGVEAIAAADGRMVLVRVPSLAKK